MPDLNFSLHKNIITEFGLNQLLPEEQETALRQLGDIIFQKVILKIMELLSENDLDEFNNLLQENKEAEIFTFLKNKIPNFETVIDETVAEFKQETTDLAETIKTQGQI